jgi:hypothetical protein
MSAWRGSKRNTPWLAGMIALAAVYAVLLFTFHTFTGQVRLDGIIGIVVGLYICSHPAANLVDRLVFGRYLSHGLSRSKYILWWGLNLLVLLIGLGVIMSGTTLFTVLR